MRLRDYTPRGYNARHILILIVPMLLFLLAITLFFFNSHVYQVNTKLSRSVAQELGLVMRELDRDPASFQALTASARESGLMDVGFSRGVRELQKPPGRSCCTEFGEQLAHVAPYPFAYSYTPGDMLVVHILRPDGLLEARFDRKRVVVITAHFFVLWSIGISALLLATSYAFLRNQVRSITQLAAAADAFGRGEDAPDYRPSGALEVRQAARSLIRMRNRIRRHADQRTTMLAGVSHDLRTPLTRLKLELALLPKAIDMKAAKADITEMERMLDGYLAFARGEEGEQPVESDLTQLTEDASGHVASRTSLEMRINGPVVMRLRPLALKRAITNLVNNAADHAKAVRVSVLKEAGSAAVIVEDNGPGIDTGKVEEAFRPFSRLDPSRNQNVSGVGLGLTIARDTARAHGGDVTLGRSEMGGLKAILRLPLEAAPAKT
jgi:two-component system osmolarity sensor histidine kinase EnvZ